MTHDLPRTLRVALVHDWLTGMRGGEKVLEVLAEMFPQAPIYTMVHVPGAVSPTIEAHRICCSALQRMPGARSKYRYYLPLMPWLVERLRIEPVDLVVSISTCVAKAIVPPKGARHAAYVNTPMRYLYDRYGDYFGPGRASWPVRLAMGLVRRPLQQWDRASTARIDSLVGNSTFVAERIRTVYGRAAGVIHPPVDVARFAAARRAPDDYYLMVCALVPYKNVDVAVEAFRTLDRRLVVAGSGPMYQRLRATCPPNVELRGWVDDAELVDLVAGCRAFLQPNVEDFGIAPLEATAAGRPVIALGLGGARDTICDIDRCDRGAVSNAFGPTGIFYDSNAPSALAEAVRRFEATEGRFDVGNLAAWVAQFNRPRFEQQMTRWLHAVLEPPGFEADGSVIPFQPASSCSEPPAGTNRRARAS